MELFKIIVQVDDDHAAPLLAQSSHHLKTKGNNDLLNSRFDETIFLYEHALIKLINYGRSFAVFNMKNDTYNMHMISGKHSENPYNVISLMSSKPFPNHSNYTASTPNDPCDNGSPMEHCLSRTVVDVPGNDSPLTDLTYTPTNEPQYHIQYPTY